MTETRREDGLRVLGGLSAAAFLGDYWQRRPLLVRQAFPGFEPPLDGGDLAGLALEDTVESRLVRGSASQPWRVRHGPFAEGDFLQAPERDWTLLVQDVDKHVPDAAWITDAFDFLPQWQLDDLMVSYAVPGGSVGPHVDRYDVFLLQGHGVRRWQIGPPGSGRETLSGGLRLLDGFEATDTWDLEPGDLLYLPPGVPHHGVAVTACTTWSIGLRSVSALDLLTGLVDDLGRDEQALAPIPDTIPTGRRPPARLTDRDLAHWRAALRQLLADDRQLDRAIARTLSGNKPGFLETDDEAEDLQILPSAATPSDPDVDRLPSAGLLVRHPAVRLTLLPATADDAARLCINGEEQRLPLHRFALADCLCGKRQVPVAALDGHLTSADNRRWLQQLLDRGLWEHQSDQGGGNCQR